MKVKKIKVSRLLMYVLLILGALLSLFPFYWLAVMATNESAAFMQYPPVLTFGNKFVENLKNLLENVDFLTAFWNTVFVSVVRTLAGAFFLFHGSFLFRQIQIPGKKISFCILYAYNDDPPPTKYDSTIDYYE